MKTQLIIILLLICMSGIAQVNSSLIEENRELRKQYNAYQNQYDSLSSILDSIDNSSDLIHEVLIQSEHDHLSTSDSLLVLKQVYMYDFERKEFDDIDEMYLEELWDSDNRKASELFYKAIKLKSAPIHERMIIASYLYRKLDLNTVKYVLSQCENRVDTIKAFQIMDSYSIRYSFIGIDEELLKKYCQTCEYK